MTTKTPQQASAVEAKCQKCGSQAKSIEYDIVGMVITCAICGKCVYMDRNNQPIEEQQELEKTKTKIQKSDTPVEATPSTAEIRQGYNLEYQERQPKERSLETAIDEPEESKPETITSEAEESEMETETNEMETENNEVEDSKMETETNEPEDSKMETETNEPEESEMETVTSEVEESEPETVTSEIEEAEMETETKEVKESEMETETKEVKESEMETETKEVEESEMETETKEVEEYELETVTSEAKEYELETVTSEMEEAKMETVTSEAEVKPETKTNKIEESEMETVTSEAEESRPETFTSEVEETKQPAINTAEEPEMQNDGCPNCGKPKDPRDVRRFQRTALRQCTTCPNWEINPGQEREPGNQNLAVSIGLQMKFQGASNKEIQEKVSLLTGNLQVGRNSMHYWIRRYAKPAIERAKKLQVVNSSGEWELDIISLKYRTQQYHCWSITDSRTQYILATERTSQLRIGEELFKMAIHAAGQRPHTILLSPNMKKGTPGLAEQARTATLIQRSPSEENSNGSMARLRNAVTKWTESSRGEFNQETMGYVLGALAMSINLFEQSEQLDDQTPAEAAGVETLYRNWEDMVIKIKIKATKSPAASRDRSSETTAEGQNAAEPVETVAEGQRNRLSSQRKPPEPVDAAEPVETMAEDQYTAVPVAEGQDAEEPVETMAEDLDPAGPVETMKGGKYKTITQELGKVLKELEQHRESLIREHRQVVRDQQAVQRTMEILNKEQPAVNDVSQETAPVA